MNRRKDRKLRFVLDERTHIYRHINHLLLNGDIAVCKDECRFDSIFRMQNQLTDLAAGGHLATFVGMLTDARSFLSYARHEYFRRILCDLLGTWVEDGEFPNDEKALDHIVRGTSYENAKTCFGV